jgi:hypothetical protein
MRHPPLAQLSHYRRFARHRELFRPPAIDPETETLARRERQIHQVHAKTFSGLMIL